MKKIMERYRILILTVLMVQSLFAASQTFWKVENDHGDEILLTIEVHKEKNTFEAWSRKDALKDLAGIFTYSLAKAAGKLKYPEIVFIEGKALTTGDTLRLNGNFNYFDKQFMFSASISGMNFNGSYLDQKGRSHPLTGIKVPDCKPLKDYSQLIATAFQITDKILVNPLWLKSDEWLEFKKRVDNLKPKISDDYELAATFFWLGKKLPFSPFEITKSRPKNISSDRKNHVGLHEINTHTALIDGNSLPRNQKEMDSLAMIVNEKVYRNLIVDLRGRSRLTPDAANILINYLSDRPFNAGVYLTRRWSDNNPPVPIAQDYRKLFNSFDDADFQSLELYKDQGRYLNIVPGERSFRGKLWLLTDSKTSGVAEMVSYTVKNTKIGTVVGQKSAGVTFLTENIRLNGEYDLVLPDCDFYTIDGKSLNNIGVEPDVLKSGDEIIKYVLGLTSNH